MSLRHSRMPTLGDVPVPLDGPMSPTSRRGLTTVDRKSRSVPAWRRLPVYVRTGAIALALFTAVLIVARLGAGTQSPEPASARDWGRRASSDRTEYSEDSTFQWPADTRLKSFRSSESSSEDADEDGEALRVEEGDGVERAIFVVADEDDLLSFTPIACGLVNGGHEVEIVSVAGADALQAVDSVPCEFANVYTATESSFGTLVGRSDVMFVVADLLELHASLVAAGAVDVKHRHPIDGLATIIALPRDELHALNWVGTLSIDALKNWHLPRIQIAVVTNDRLASLTRLTDSLETALYANDDVALAISLEQTADRETRLFVDELEWPHGHLSIRHRVILGGLLPSIVESWYPTTNHSYGLFLEDDIEVSPLFYFWTKWTLLRYRYSRDSADKSQRLFSISLYQPKLDALQPTGKRPWDAHEFFAANGLPSTAPYRSQIPCSWGALMMPNVWREFHAYLTSRLYETAIPLDQPWILEDIASNKWSRSWKRFLIELIYSRGYSAIYPNYADFVSFSTNWVEPGAHVRAPKGSKAAEIIAARQAKYGVPLMSLDNATELVNGLPEGRLPPWNELPLLSLWSELTTEEDIIRRGYEGVKRITTCTDLPNDPPPTPSYDLHDLACATPRADGQAALTRPRRLKSHDPLG